MNGIRLDSRVVLVTGAATNFGLAIAEALLSAGADLVAFDVNRNTLHAAGEHLAANHPRRTIIPVVGDAAKEEDVVRAVSAAREHFGTLHVLVNNAAIGGRYPFLEYPTEPLDRMIAVNLRGPLLFTREAGRLIATSGGGAILHIGSVGAARGHAHNVVYDACKGALDAAARAMAVDLAQHNIRVNVLSPSRPIDDDKSPPEHRADSVELGGIGILKRDLGAAVVFFASDLAARITGQSLWIDNGLTATLRWPERGLHHLNLGDPQ